MAELLSLEGVEKGYARGSDWVPVLSSQGTLGAPNGPGTRPGSTGDSSTIVGQGTPNGNSASETAVIRLGVRHTITRPFSHRALKLTGRLLNSNGHPIGAAELDVLQETAGSSAPQVIGHTKTRANGTFLIHVSAGPSV